MLLLCVLYLLLAMLVCALYVLCVFVLLRCSVDCVLCVVLSVFPGCSSSFGLKFLRLVCVACPFIVLKLSLLCSW